MIERECELCGKVIEESESYFANRDGGDSHLDCWQPDNDRLILRRGFTVHPKQLKKSSFLHTPWSKVTTE